MTINKEYQTKENLGLCVRCGKPGCTCDPETCTCEPVVPDQSGCIQDFEE